MESTSRPLTKRPRAALACNPCRLTKSKCDGARPACERCVSSNTNCLYTQAVRDKRMDRQEERRANLALRGRVKDLEAQLASGVHPSRSSEPNSATPEGQHNYNRPDRGTPYTESLPDSTADVLATGLFDQSQPVDIGYFGPSSNHAFFWSLTTCIENLGHRSAHRYQEPLQTDQVADGSDPTQLQLPPPNASQSDRSPSASDDALFPGRQTAIEWTTRFFDTIGAVLPYVSETALLREIDRVDAEGGKWQDSSRSTQSLLNIVFAYALYTMNGQSPEPFYRRALNLLDEKTLYMPCIESIQALVLMSSFQQNTQRAMESWTSNHLAVKASYQLGIQAPSTYEHLGIQEKQSRAILWFGVVHQDRILSCALGRTMLIPVQHVVAELSEIIDPTSQARVANSLYSRKSVVYFRQVVSVYEIMGSAVDSIFNYNISSSKRLTLEDLITKTISLSSRLEKWCENVEPPGILPPNADPSTWPAVTFETDKFEILLSIMYYRVRFMVNGPLLYEILERETGTARHTGSERVLRDAASSLLKTYLPAIQAFHQLLSGILQRQPSFLRRSAIWWVCNYMMFTVCLHLLAFFLLSVHSAKSAEFGVSTSDIEILLRQSLDTLKLVGGSSIMSRKAHRCLLRYLQILTNTAPINTEMVHPAGLQEPPAIADLQLNQFSYASRLPQDYSAELIPMPTGDFFGNMNQDEFLQAGFMNLEQGISDFDATGFM